MFIKISLFLSVILNKNSVAFIENNLSGFIQIKKSEQWKPVFIPEINELAQFELLGMYVL